MENEVLSYLRDEGECPNPADEPPDAPPRLRVPKGTLAPTLRKTNTTILAVPSRTLSSPRGMLNDNIPPPGVELGSDEYLEFLEWARGEWPAWQEREKATQAWLDQVDAASSRVAVIEAAAWYQPITFYGTRAKIILRQQGIRAIAALLNRRGHGIGATDAVEIAEQYLLLHEQFHCKVESYAIHMHLDTAVPRYRRYHRAVFDPARQPTLSDGLLEEGLATAHAIRELRHHLSSEIENDVAGRAADCLEADLANAAPGYRTAKSFLEDQAFTAGCVRLAQAVADGRLPGSPDPRRALDNPLLAERVPVGMIPAIVTLDSPEAPDGLFLAVNDRGLRKLLKKRGYEPTKRGDGSHQVWVNPSGGLPITLPHRREQTGYQTIKSTAKALGMTPAQLKEAAAKA